jgi:hypothetical protein
MYLNESARFLTEPDKLWLVCGIVLGCCLPISPAYALACFLYFPEFGLNSAKEISQIPCVEHIAIANVSALLGLQIF